MTRSATLSIRLRLTLWYSAVLAVGLAVFGGGMWFALQHRLLTDLDTRLAERVEGLQTVLELESKLRAPVDLRDEVLEFAREVPEGELMSLRVAGGEILLPRQGQHFFDRMAIPAGLSTIRHDGTPYRILSTDFQLGSRKYEVAVAGSQRDVDRTMADFRTLLFLMIPAVLAIACIGGYWISRRALTPVDEITQVARSISVQNLSRRLAVPRTGDELERMSQTWNEVLERLEGAVKRIRQFTADASHELRTPLALIRATSDLALRRERTPAEYQKALADIRAEADQMTELTESLLTLARSDTNDMRLELSSVDLNEIARAVIAEALPMAESKGIALAGELSAAAARADANAASIRRLLLALVDNALKYTEAGGVVTVCTVLVNDGVMLSVRDTGVGIPPDALHHIFERFYRVDTARGAGSGSGLGLAIAQAIAEAHGSSIEVESVVGSGSIFQLLIRLQRGVK